MGGYLLDVSRHYSSGVLSCIGQTCLSGTRLWFSVCGTALSHLMPLCTVVLEYLNTSPSFFGASLCLLVE